MKQTGLIFMVLGSCIMLLSCSDGKSPVSNTHTRAVNTSDSNRVTNTVRFPDWAEVMVRKNSNGQYSISVEVSTSHPDSGYQLEEILNILPFPRSELIGISVSNAEKMNLNGLDTLTNLKVVSLEADGYIGNIALVEDLPLTDMWFENNIANAPDFSRLKDLKHVTFTSFFSKEFIDAFCARPAPRMEQVTLNGAQGPETSYILDKLSSAMSRIGAYFEGRGLDGVSYPDY